MLDFLKGIWDVITSLIGFVVHGIESLLNLLTHIPQYLAVLTEMIGYVPGVFQAFMLAGIGIAVIFLIVGRGK